eukprot:SM000048S16578  [mRNA]  locus=s48:529741:532031:- [translate_table: standard]
MGASQSAAESGSDGDGEPGEEARGRGGGAGSLGVASPDSSSPPSSPPSSSSPLAAPLPTSHLPAVPIVLSLKDMVDCQPLPPLPWPQTATGSDCSLAPVSLRHNEREEQATSNCPRPAASTAGLAREAKWQSLRSSSGHGQLGGSGNGRGGGSASQPTSLPSASLPSLPHPLPQNSLALPPPPPPPPAAALLATTTAPVLPPPSPQLPRLALMPRPLSPSPSPAMVLVHSAPGAALSPRRRAAGLVVEVFLMRHAESTMNVQPHLIGGRSPTATLTERGQQQAAALGRYLREYHGLRFHAVYSSPLQRARATAAVVCQEMGLCEEVVEVADALAELSQGTWEGRLRRHVYTDAVLARMAAMQPDFRAPGGESQRQVAFRAVDFLHSVVLPAEAASVALDAPDVAGSSKAAALAEGVGILDCAPSFSGGGNCTTDEAGGAGKWPASPRAAASSSGGGGSAGGGGGGRGGVHRVAVFTHAMTIKCVLAALFGVGAGGPDLHRRLDIDPSSITRMRHSSVNGWQLTGLNDTAHLVLARSPLFAGPHHDQL